MQTEHRGEPSEDAIGNERDVAKDAENAQEAHILRHEGQEYHCRSYVPGKIGHHCHDP
jgi:hypothetical protein